jgi:hypothetical protein
MTPQAHTFQIPRPLRVEHDELHARLARATRESGPIGIAAAEVARILHPHFVNEEAYALPPLGLLPALSAGRIGPEMKPAVDMAQRLKSELPRLLDEHQAIVAALQTLRDAAHQVQRSDIVAFADKLILHAETEEQVLYPATILIGEFLSAKLRIVNASEE